VGAFRRIEPVPASAFGLPGGGEIWAEKLCVVYAARAVRRLGAPTEPGHLAVRLTLEDALEALASEGQREMLARALA
jgi:8-oxo-dGTP diphosphatase